MSTIWCMERGIVHFKDVTLVWPVQMILGCIPQVPDRRLEPGQDLLPGSKGQEKMTSSCSRGGLGCPSGQNLSWHSLGAVVVESLSLEVSRRCGCDIGDMVWWWCHIASWAWWSQRSPPNIIPWFHHHWTWINASEMHFSFLMLPWLFGAGNRSSIPALWSRANLSGFSRLSLEDRRVSCSEDNQL